MANAIELTNVSKVYRRYSRKRQFATLKSALLSRSLVRDLNPEETFPAVQDVTYNLPSGRTLGVIGRNGSGKSTLLKLVAGITKPTTGSVKVNGRISALIELGAGCDAVLIGPGMTDAGAVAELTGCLLNHLDGPALVLDALAFSTLRADAGRRGPMGRIVVTPHAGEMAKFLGIRREDVEGDPLKAARKAAAGLPGVVAMKGAETYVVSEDGEVLLSRNGCIGLATSGSGDTLAGILAGLLARGTQPVLATAWAVYMHGQAGTDLAKERGEFGFLAREIPAEIPRIMMGLRAAPATG